MTVRSGPENKKVKMRVQKGEEAVTISRKKRRKEGRTHTIFLSFLSKKRGGGGSCRPCKKNEILPFEKKIRKNVI